MGKKSKCYCSSLLHGVGNLIYSPCLANQTILIAAYQVTFCIVILWCGEMCDKYFTVLFLIFKSVWLHSVFHLRTAVHSISV